MGVVGKIGPIVHLDASRKEIRSLIQLRVLVTCDSLNCFDDREQQASRDLFMKFYQAADSIIQYRLAHVRYADIFGRVDWDYGDPAVGALHFVGLMKSANIPRKLCPFLQLTNVPSVGVFPQGQSRY